MNYMYMKARLVSLQWFVLTMLPQKTLASSSICSVLFDCACKLLCFWMQRERIEIFHCSPLNKWKIVDQCNSSRRRKGVKEFPIAAGTKVTLVRFRIEDLGKIFQMMSLCSVWWCSNMIFMANTFPKLKKSSSWKASSVSKEAVICVRIQSHEIAWNKYYGAVTKRMNFIYPVV